LKAIPCLIFKLSHKSAEEPWQSSECYFAYAIKAPDTVIPVRLPRELDSRFLEHVARIIRFRL